MKKNAILYIRVSTDEQAKNGFSLHAQEVALKRYCQHNDINVLTMYSDDHSAKDFKRPGYIEMKEYVIKNAKQIQYILFTQWSRFSRSALETGKEVHFFKSLKIQPKAIEQEFDDSVPENKMLEAIYYILPQIENERLSLRTISGMRQAIKEGRYIYKVPVGYKRNMLTKDIEIDEGNATIIRYVFEKYSKGIFTAEELRIKAAEMGLPLKKQAFINMLSNQTYTGKVLLKAYKEEGEQIFNGTHQAIIDENIFHRVQKILKHRGKPYKQAKGEIENALPLRGNLTCPLCGKILTGGTPKGNGGRYPYYHCQQTKYGCKFRVSAKEAHKSMIEYLKTFQPNEEVIELFTQILTEIFQVNDKERYNQKEIIENEIQVLKKRIETVTDDYADGNMPVAQFRTITERFQDKIGDLVMKHATIAKVPPNFNNYISYSCGLISNLSQYYATSFPAVQHKLIGLIFPEKLTFWQNGYKTPKTNEVFALICATGEGLKKNSPARIARQYSEAPAAGLEPATL